MLRTAFLAKLAGAFALGHLLPRPKPEAIFVFQPERLPKYIVRLADPPGAVEAQYWIDRGFSHCSWPTARLDHPLREFVTPTDEVRL